MLTANAGEQAFYTNTEKGEVGSYMGASTTSGPIRDVGMKFISPTEIEHEPAWYSEPFQGNYILLHVTNLNFIEGYSYLILFRI